MASWKKDIESDGSESDDVLTDSERREFELEIFRREWRGELSNTATAKNSPTSTTSSNSSIAEKFVPTRQERAAKLYDKGVREEQRGRMYEAIKFYREAVHLVPDIEEKLAQSGSWTQGQQQKENELQASGGAEKKDPEEDEAVEGLECLLAEWEQVLRLHGGVWRVCVPADPQMSEGRGHFSECPFEVVALILRWVVSRDLDVRSLDILAGVCRGFYQACRDPEIWRRICMKIWGPHCETPEQVGCASWREMYLERPHALYHGCYIARIAYFRHGENSFQDRFYRPFYEVEYFRYLRFFPEGKCMMLTTPDDPYQALPHLRHRIPRHGNILVGQFRLHGDTILASMQRVSDMNTSAIAKQIAKARRNRSQEERSEKTFYIELRVKDFKGKKNAEVVWTRYSVWTYYPARQLGSASEFELSPSSFPPCRFSRVKSYASVSDSPLP